jgi:hypothetical protein
VREIEKKCIKEIFLDLDYKRPRGKKVQRDQNYFRDREGEGEGGRKRIEMRVKG